MLMIVSKIYGLSQFFFFSIWRLIAVWHIWSPYFGVRNIVLLCNHKIVVHPIVYIYIYIYRMKRDRNVYSSFTLAKYVSKQTQKNEKKDSAEYILSECGHNQIKKKIFRFLSLSLDRSLTRALSRE